VDTRNIESWTDELLKVIKEKGFFKRYGIYLGRWQASTPVLGFAVGYFGYLGEWAAAAIANLIGGIFFFWIDRFIFQKMK